MIPSNWKRRLDRLDVRSRTGGGDDISAALAEIFAEYYVEAARARDDMGAFKLLQSAWQIDAVRTRYLLGEWDAPTAQIWIDVANEHLTSLVRFAERGGSRGRRV